ncbi:MAG: hypothetical protein NO474_03040 [Methanomassiliicoccales archaeon]|nr:hypothetical protein [Methanomassiliicoccales archaeon]
MRKMMRSSRNSDFWATKNHYVCRLKKDFQAIGSFFEVILTLMIVTVGIVILSDVIMSASQDIVKPQNNLERVSERIAEQFFADDRFFAQNEMLMIPPLYNISSTTYDFYGVNGCSIVLIDITDQEKTTTLLKFGDPPEEPSSLFSVTYPVNLLYSSGLVGAGLIIIGVW